MAKKEGSVAPKERVNIVYKSYTGDAVEEIELPMRFLVIGDFTGRDEETPIEQRDPINVDKDNFNQVLEAQKVSVDIAVPNKLSGQDGDELSVHLDIKNMRDFTPDAYSMNSTLEPGSGSSPSASRLMFSRRTHSLKLATSSSLVMMFSGTSTPMPEMQARCSNLCSPCRELPASTVSSTRLSIFIACYCPSPRQTSARGATRPTWLSTT